MRLYLLASAAAVHARLAEPVVFACWDVRLERAAKREGLEPLRSRTYVQHQT